MSKTVLFVDDEPNICHALQRVFADEIDLDVVTAGDGPQALELLASRPVDLVVSDEMLPGMDGIALLGSVRRLYPDIQVMMLTGYAEDKGSEIGDALGRDIVIVNKPWETDALRRVVRELLGRRESRAE